MKTIEKAFIKAVKKSKAKKIKAKKIKASVKRAIKTKEKIKEIVMTDEQEKEVRSMALNFGTTIMSNNRFIFLEYMPTPQIECLQKLIKAEIAYRTKE